MVERLNPTLREVSDAVLVVAAELSVEEVLQRLVHAPRELAPRELAAARFAALGLPDGAGGFRRFLTSGMSDEPVASLGRSRGSTACWARCSRRRRRTARATCTIILAFAAVARRPPRDALFIVVPIVAPEGVIGAFHPAEKIGAQEQDGMRHFGLVVDDKEATRRVLEAAGVGSYPAAASTSSIRSATASRSCSTTRSSSASGTRSSAAWASSMRKPQRRSPS